jgi:outer membrane receptor protein involved in Fe transport
MLLTLAGLSSVTAQTVTGSLVGHVEDESGGAVAGARVVATEITRGTMRETTTNEEGNYTISSMDPGTYRVEVEQQSFKKFIRDKAEVTINTTVRVDARLEVGGLAETVQVSGEQPILQTDRADLNLQIQHTQVENLPLSADRNYQSLLALVPGVTEPAVVGSSFGNPVGSLKYQVNGMNERYNNEQLDGTINNITNVTSQLAIVPPAEAIEVVDVSTNAYDAEQGRAAGGVVNVQIKSGTNQFHGSAFYFNTNSALGARNTISTLAKPHTNLTQFGFTIGGPIVKDKTFFFADYQGGRDRKGQNGLLSVPTQAFRNGDFSALLSRPTPIIIYDPATGTASGSNRTAFAGNKIPVGRISPVAQKILAMLPLPNRPGDTANYETTGTVAQNRNAFDIKVNHTFSESTTAFARYSFFKGLTSDPPAFGDLGGPTTANGSTAAIGPSKNQGATLNLTHTFSPTLITEARFGLVRVLIEGNSPIDPGLGAAVGISNPDAPNFFNQGLPRISISGYSFLGALNTLPFKIAETSTNYVNIWTKQSGNHSIRFGADVRDLILNKYQANSGAPRGEFSFTTGVTAGNSGATSSANAFASFLLGLSQTTTNTEVTQLSGYRQRQYFFFAQDRWQATPKLTINYGLRWEIYPYATVPHAGDQSSYDPATDKVLVAGYGNINKQLNVNTDYKDFAPRFGIAYRLDDKTVIRSGYGISYIPLSINQLVGSQYPAQILLTVAGANSKLAAGNIANGVPSVPLVDVSSGVISVPGNIAVNPINTNSRRGYVQTYNFTVEREFLGFAGTVSYVGSRGTRLPGTLNINAATTSSNADRPFAKLFGRTADVLVNDFMLSSSYNALQAKLQRRFGRSSLITAAYTWSKSLDYTDAFALQNDINIDANRGPSTFDRTHNFVFSHVTNLPFGKGERFLQNGLGSAILGGWQLSGVFTARTGAPVDITGVNLAASKFAGTANKPNVTGPSQILGGTGPGQLWFDTSVFVEPVAGTFGNVGRNTMRGPGYVNYDATLARSFALGERMQLQFRATAFNLTNTAHFDVPDGTFTANTFGQITSSFGERRVRFGLRLTF